MYKKQTFKRIIFFLISVLVFLWAASVVEARIGGGQKYSGKGTKSSSRSTGSYSSSSSRTSSGYSSSGSSGGSSGRYYYSDSDRNAIFMIIGEKFKVPGIFFFIKTGTEF
jgi:uncharacterized membrane protein